MTQLFVDYISVSANSLNTDFYFLLKEFENVFIELVDEALKTIKKDADYQILDYNDTFIESYHQNLVKKCNLSNVYHMLIAMIRIKKLAEFYLNYVNPKNPIYVTLYNESSRYINDNASDSFKRMIIGIPLTTRFYSSEIITTIMRKRQIESYGGGVKKWMKFVIDSEK